MHELRARFGAVLMPALAPITVAIARFEDLLARGLRGVIDGDQSLEVVAEDFKEDRIAVILRAHRPRVAILDADALPALASVAELGRLHPDTRLVLLAAHPTTAECAQLLAFGASACLGRRAQARDILTAIHLASRGLQLAPRASPDSPGRPAMGSARLTRREAEVLPMLQRGSTNAEIAAALHVAVETVRAHARNIYRKLGVSSRRELAPIPPRSPLQDAEAPAPPLARHSGTFGRERQRRPGTFRR
jgi:DNA-binding NarL/FixJ family response regulator